MTNLLRLWLLLAACAVTYAANAQGVNSDDLLDPEQAFKVTVEPDGADHLRATWTAAEGYYLYRTKIHFRSDTAGVTLGDPQLPKGHVKHDENFGEMEIYRGNVTAGIPVTRAAGAPGTLELTAESQGCADLGVCYPPQRRKLSVVLAAAQPAPAPAAAALPEKSGGARGALALLGEKLGLGSGNSSGGGGGDQEVLDPDVAFVLAAAALDPSTAVVRIDIAPRHYLYRDKFKFSVPDGSGVQLGEPQLPPGQEKNDEFFGRIRIFHDHVEAKLPLKRVDGAAGKLNLEVAYQGCAEAGVCYPPLKKSFTLDLPAVASASAAGTGATSGAAAAVPATRPAVQAAAAPAAARTADGPVSEQDRLAAALASGNKGLTLLTFLGLGLLLAFTPCVFPMIPILSSIIVGQGHRLTTGRAFTLSAVYVLAMALTYTVAGVVAGLFGANIQAAFQNVWVLSSFAAVFVALALSMFGFYELQLPSALQTRLTEVSNRQQGGTLAGVGVMGLLSALIVGPCVAPPLMGALIYIGKTGDPWLGGSALFALSLGMGAPLVAIGTSAGKLLPRAGAWMDAVKAVFGVLLLMVALWMLERILPPMVTMLLWALLFITSAVYMGALEPAHSGWRKLWKGLGVVLLGYGALQLIGAASGGRDPLAPLAHIRAAAANCTPTAMAAETGFKRIRTAAELDQALAAAHAAGRPVLLDFYADWCVSCKELEKYTFNDPAVITALGPAVMLQADVTGNSDDDKALLKRFGLIGPPALLFFGRDGTERTGYRLVGFEGAPEFTARVGRALE